MSSPETVPVPASTSVRPDQTTLGYRRFRCRECRRALHGRTGTPLNRLRSLTDVLCPAVLWRPDGCDRRPQSSRGSWPPLPPPERSVQQEKHDDAQHRQGRHHFTHCDIHGLMVHRSHASRSLSPRPLLTASTLQHTGGCVAQADPALGAPPVCRSIFAHPRVLGGGLVLAPEAVHATCPRQHTSPGAQRVAAAGTPQGEETCQGAHTQSWVKYPFLGTRLGQGAGGGRCPSSRPLTRRRDSPCQGIAPRRPLASVRR
jgi:hypothetical protein